MIKFMLGLAAGVVGASTAFAAQRPTVNDAPVLGAAAAKVNFDASAASAKAPSGAELRKAQALNSRNAARAGNPASVFDDRLGVPTFLWAPASVHAPNFGVVKVDKRAETLARDYLSQQASLLNLSRASIDEARAFDTQDTGHGPMIVRFEQYKDGIEVFNRGLNVAMTREGQLVSTSGYFAPPEAGLSAYSRATSLAGYTLTPETAITRAFADAGAKVSLGALSLDSIDGAYSAYRISNAGSGAIVASTKGDDRPRAKKVWFFVDDTYVPAWYVEVRSIETASNKHLDYGYVIAGNDGRVLFRKDQIAYEGFTYNVYADPVTFHPYDSPRGNGLAPVTVLDPNFHPPRVGVALNQVTLNNAIGSFNPASVAINDPWLAPGATVTTGNNADAYLDLVAGNGFTANSIDVRGNITAAGQFIYPYTIDSNLTVPSQRQAAAVNLFYMNNWLHDFFYVSGFTESTRNAQVNNYGRGGSANDSLLLEGQDYSGTDNANQSTPADGGRPRQQMYVFSGIARGSFTVVSPALGQYPFGYAGYGATTYDVTQTVVPAVSTDGTSTGCVALANGSAVAGHIALIDRGVCSFQLKSRNAELAGAAGVVLVNNDTGVINPAGDTTAGAVTIPTMMISLADGTSVRNALANGPVSVRMQLTTGPTLDGTMDNGIIAHEHCHYVTNRLIGNASGLNNNQGGSMGEGWGDFCTLLLAVRAEDRSVSGNDRYQGAYSSGLYVDGSEYFGIRRAPYSTSFSINPLTFRHIENFVALPTTAPIAFGGNGVTNSEVHNSGEVWANTLWEVYAAFLNDPRYSFAQAQARIRDYFIGSLRLTPNSPTYVEARNAWIAAAQSTGDNADLALIVNAFAKRGLGLLAVAPERNDISHSNVRESFVGYGPAVAVSSTVISNGSAFPQQDCDADGVLDVNETARVTFTLVNRGLVNLPAGAVARLTADGNVTLSGGGRATLPAMAVNGTATVSFDVTLRGASTASALNLSLNVVDAVDATRTYGDPVVTTLNVNYNTATARRSTDDISVPRLSLVDWALANGPLTNNAASVPWAISNNFAPVFANGSAWYLIDSPVAFDRTLVTPAVQVASTGTFSMSFDHYFSFDSSTALVNNLPSGFDGGVIEASVDGGAYTDVTNAAIGGSFSPAASGYNAYVRTFGTTVATRRLGFANGIAGNGLQRVTVNFGSTLNGRSVRLRFRGVGDASIGAFGWLIDNISFTNAVTPPFSGPVADPGGCTDSTPDVFSFVNNTNAPVSAKVTSNAVTITGINTAAPVTISRQASYSVNGGPFQLTAGTINRGDTLALRVSTSTSTAPVTATVTVGGVSTTWTVTVGTDTAPDAFTYGTVSNLVPGATTTTGNRTISGINASASISVGEPGTLYSVNGEAFTASAGTVSLGDTVRLQATASASYGATTTASVNVGGTVATLTLVTQAQDTTPDAFSFGSATAAANAVSTSAAVYVAGINAPTPISISGDASAMYSVNGGAYTNAPGTVSRSQSVRVRLTAPATGSATATVTVGGVSGTYTVSTSP